MKLLEVRDVTVVLGGRPVVEGVSFEVDQGDVLAIVGPNGSGKSTLMRAILGLVEYSGEVLWHGECKVGYVPQHFTFDRSFPVTVFEFLLMKMPRVSLWQPSKRARHEITATLKEVRADQLIDKMLGNLSGGELQRVLIAGALINKPTMLCLDEPSSGIDIGGEETVYTLIHELIRSKGLTIMLISHDLDIVYQHASSVLCLNRKLICSGIPREALSAGTLEKLYGHHAGRYEHAERSHRHKSGHDHTIKSK